MEYKKPELGKRNFACPHCGVVSKQEWYSVAVKPIIHKNIEEFELLIKDDNQNEISRKAFVVERQCYHQEFENILISICDNCKNYCVWGTKHKKLLFPLAFGPSPNPDLPKYIIEDFNEARSIVNSSPRASAALSRLILEKFLKHLEVEGDKLNIMIGNLVKQGLDEQLQKAMDALRVFGNEAVHAGVIDLKDDKETAIALLNLINILAEDMISKKKKINKLYSKLPSTKRRAIETRDNRKKTK
ncbi:MAG: DUF4145 domain-containing protein [Candidatus Heimdallarchaeaceae archaeon]